MRNPFSYRFGLPSPFYDNETGSFAPAFSPAALFALNEPGVWFDPSDLTTLFQEPAGTTAVTTPGQTVGLMLDKSKGLVLGSELVVNGNFSGGVTTGWASSSGFASTATVVSGEFQITATAGFGRQIQAITCVVGKTYKVSCTARVVSGTVIALIERTSSAGNGIGPFTPTTSTTTTPLSMVFTATNTTEYICVGSGTNSTGQVMAFDNISVRELAGNHATQATLAARPTYAIEPAGGRRNLLTWSEDFRTTAQAGETRPWVYVGASVSANVTATTDPLGGNTAEKLIEAAAAGAHSSRQGSLTTAASTYSFSCYLKAAERNWVLFNVDTPIGSNGYAEVYVNLTTGAFGNQAAGNGYAIVSKSISDAGNGWWRVSLTYTATARSDAGVQILLAESGSVVSYTGNGTSGVYIWGSQLELGSTATPYQKVTTTYDVTEAGVASMSYLYFDGVNDAMATSTITPGIDKAQVFVGVRKLSGTGGMILESSAIAPSNPGAFFLSSAIYNAADYAVLGSGSIGGFYVRNYLSFPAPISNVLSAIMDNAGATIADEVSLRANGVVATVGGTSVGSSSGNFGNYPFYLGGRAGTSTFYTGHLYSLITRFGANLDTPTITNTETWVAGKTGFFTPVITGVPTIGVS